MPDAVLLSRKPMRKMLLRGGGRAKRKEQNANSKDRDFFLHVFLCLDLLVTRHLTLVRLT